MRFWDQGTLSLGMPYRRHRIGRPTLQSVNYSACETAKFVACNDGKRCLPCKKVRQSAASKPADSAEALITVKAVMPAMSARTQAAPFEM